MPRAGAMSADDIEGARSCSFCGEVKSLSEFYRNAQNAARRSVLVGRSSAR